MNEPLSLYLHIPFCASRCGYCDFNTYAGKESLIPDYLKAIQAEILISRDLLVLNNPVHSIYFGGGTPSLLPAAGINTLMETIRTAFDVREDAEVTLEMNPGDADADLVRQIRHAGINRVSLGMQSADPRELTLMDRRHTPEKTLEAVEHLKSAGINNFSLDLIYGFPQQTMESWRKSLETALSLDPAHISLYALSVEEGTPLKRRIELGQLDPPDDDRTAEMYQAAEEILEKDGFLHYEISNWARTAEVQSRHNTQYWLTQPYLGLGAGAHGNVYHIRTKNHTSIETYIEAMQKAENHKTGFPAASEVIPQTELMEMQDFMILGLRLLQTGASPERFKQRFSVTQEEIFHYQIERLLAKGLIEYGPERQLLLRKDRIFISNQVFMEFI